MKRSELRRLTPMKSSKRGVRRIVPIAVVNRKRKAKRWAKQFHSVEFVEWSKRQPSSVSGEINIRINDAGEVVGFNVFSHSAKSRGAGGTWRDGLVLTPEEHAEEHRVGVRTFWESRGKSARVEAVEHQRRWMAYSG